MKMTNEKVWRTDSGEELIRLVGGRIQVIPAYCEPGKLRELGEAIADALAQDNKVKP